MLYLVHCPVFWYLLHFLGSLWPELGVIVLDKVNLVKKRVKKKLEKSNTERNE